MDLGAGAAFQPKIQAVDVCLGYTMKHGREYLPVSFNLNFEIAAGSFVSIVGRSGCGKSTLLHALQGLVSIQGGRLLVDGTEMTKPRRDHAVVFQEASLLPWRNTWSNILFGVEMQGHVSPERTQYCRDLVKIVGLEDFVDKHPHQLSGGMKQRANLARALALEPSLLLLDEPFAALDAQTRQLMQFELARIWQETEAMSASQKTAVFITHDIAESVFVADQVIVLSNRPSVVQEIIDIDLPRPRGAEVKASPAFAKYVDYITGLIETMPR